MHLTEVKKNEEVSIVHCIKCRTVGREGKFCTECGQRTVFSRFECPECSATNYVIDEFCAGCGTNIKKAAKEIVSERMTANMNECNEKEGDSAER